MYINELSRFEDFLFAKLPFGGATSSDLTTEFSQFLVTFFAQRCKAAEQHLQRRTHESGMGPVATFRTGNALGVVQLEKGSSKSSP